MTITGQTYLQRALAEGVLDEQPPSDAIMRLNDDLYAIDAVVSKFGQMMGTVINNVIDNSLSVGSPALSVVSQQDNAIGLVVQSADDSPAVSPFQVVRHDQEILGDIHASWHGLAIGVVNAINAFDSKIWFRTDQTLPAGASSGQWLVRPRLP